MSGNRDFLVSQSADSVTIPKAVVDGHVGSLSYAALGLLLTVLARTEGADVGYRSLQGRGLDGKATRAALSELKQAGFLFQFSIRRAGAYRLATVVFDHPVSIDEARTWLMGQMVAGVFPVAEVLHCVSHGETAQSDIAWNVLRLVVPTEMVGKLSEHDAQRISSDVSALLALGWSTHQIKKKLEELSESPPIVSRVAALLSSSTQKSFSAITTLSGEDSAQSGGRDFNQRGIA